MFVVTRQIRRFVKLCFRSNSALFLDKIIMHNRFPENVFFFIFLEKFTNHLKNTCKSSHTDQRGKNAFYPEGRDGNPVGGGGGQVHVLPLRSIHGQVVNYHCTSRHNCTLSLRQFAWQVYSG